MLNFNFVYGSQLVSCAAVSLDDAYFTALQLCPGNRYPLTFLNSQPLTAEMLGELDMTDGATIH